MWFVTKILINLWILKIGERKTILLFLLNYNYFSLFYLNLWVSLTTWRFLGWFNIYACFLIVFRHFTFNLESKTQSAFKINECILNMPLYFISLVTTRGSPQLLQLVFFIHFCFLLFCFVSFFKLGSMPSEEPKLRLNWGSVSRAWDHNLSPNQESPRHHPRPPRS